MSQAKVERNKELKANRKSINAAKKLKNLITSIVVSVICVAIVCWIGYSVYSKSQQTAAENMTKVPVDISAISDYIEEVDALE